jgi:hypothetical protein
MEHAASIGQHPGSTSLERNRLSMSPPVLVSKPAPDPSGAAEGPLQRLQRATATLQTLGGLPEEESRSVHEAMQVIARETGSSTESAHAIVIAASTIKHTARNAVERRLSSAQALSDVLDLSLTDLVTDIRTARSEPRSSSLVLPPPPPALPPLAEHSAESSLGTIKLPERRPFRRLERAVARLDEVEGLDSGVMTTVREALEHITREARSPTPLSREMRTEVAEAAATINEIVKNAIDNDLPGANRFSHVPRIQVPELISDIEEAKRECRAGTSHAPAFVLPWAARFPRR